MTLPNPEAAILLFLPAHREMSRCGAAYEAGYRKLIAKNLRLISELSLPIILVCDESPRWANAFALGLLDHRLHFLPLVGATQTARTQAALRGATRLGFERLVLVWSGTINLQATQLQKALDALQQQRLSCGLTQEHTPYLLAGHAAQLAAFEISSSTFVRLDEALCFGTKTKLSFAFFDRLSLSERHLATILFSLLHTVQAPPKEKIFAEQDAFCTQPAARSPPQ